jgi:pimeloyl-ACP methyl ester carboxylesterase
VVLVGHSLGGPVALETARRLPQRVVGVIGIDAFHLAGPAEQEELDRLREDFDDECSRFVDTALVADDSPSTVARVSGGLCGTDPAIAVALLAARRDYDLAAAIETVPVPVRALDGDGRPADAVALGARHHDFDARVIEGGGRHPMVDRPEETNRVLAQLIEEITSGNTL